MSFHGRPPLPPIKHNDILPSGGTTANKRTMPPSDDYVPMITDIICGRRGNYNGKHPGNQIFAQRVRGSISEYTNESSRRKRTIVVAKVVNSLQCDGMRFIKFDPAVNIYVELSNEQIHAKVGHAIRDQIKNHNECTSTHVRQLSPRRQPRSSSLPTPPRPPSVDNVSSNNSTVVQRKKPPRRHSDTVVQYIDKTSTFRSSSYGQSKLFGTTSYYNSPSPSPQRHYVAAKEMPLQQVGESKIGTNQGGFQFLREQRVGTDLLSRVMIDLGHHDVERIHCNDLATRATEHISSPLLPSLGMQPADQLWGKGYGKGPDGPDTSKIPPSPTNPPFAPLPLDSESNLDAQDAEELQGILFGRQSNENK